jgi:hypothetical protein
MTTQHLRYTGRVGGFPAHAFNQCWSNRGVTDPTVVELDAT